MPMPDAVPAPSAASLAGRLAEIERDLDAGRYRPGPWQALLTELRSRPRAERVALAQGISRVSDKLHAREPKRRISFAAGVLAELVFTILGAALLAWGVRHHLGWPAVLVAIIWTMTLQPLVKILVGALIGVRYSYAYLMGVEPRFKMRYGTYIAAPRGARILFHLSGAVGSPLGSWLPIPFLAPDLHAARIFCWVLFGVNVLINVVPFFIALAGRRRLGPIRLSLGSAASAAQEIREARG